MFHGTARITWRTVVAAVAGFIKGCATQFSCNAMGADDAYALAKAHGLPEGWRVKNYSGVKNYFSPTGHRYQGVRGVILELGYTPKELLAPKKERDGDIDPIAAKPDLPNHTGSISEPGVCSEGSTVKGQELSVPKRQREDDMETMAGKPDQPHHTGSKLESSGGSEVHAVKGEELSAPKRRREDDSEALASKPEQPNHTGSTLEPGVGSDYTVKGASAPEVSTRPGEEEMFEALRKLGKFKCSQVVLAAVEATATGQQAAEIIGFPPGWSVTASSRSMGNVGHIDAYYHPPPPNKRLRSIVELRSVLKDLPPMLEPGWTVPPARASIVACSKAAPSSRNEGCAETTGYTLLEVSTKDRSWDILPDDVTSIDLSSIATRVEASGWKCVSEAPLLRTFRADCDICLHVSGRLEVHASSKDLAERVARLLVGTWLADTDDS